jgi:CopG antitoxin of type II toxin-antitoxin system
MTKAKGSISKARSYQEIGEFWDTHDLGDYWEQTKPAQFEVDIESEAIYYAVEPKLSTQISSLAKERGVSPETLLNLWLQEKLSEEIPAK